MILEPWFDHGIFRYQKYHITQPSKFSYRSNNVFERSCEVIHAADTGQL